MSDFIKDFLNGKIEPLDRPELKAEGKDWVVTELDQNELYLKEKLTGEDKEHFEAYARAWNKNLEETDEAAFIAGFRLGAKFAQAVFGE